MKIVCVMIWMIVIDIVVMNLIMYMYEIDIWCKMKYGSRWCKMKMVIDGVKMRKKLEDVKWRWIVNDESKEMIIDINFVFFKFDFVVKNLSYI